MYYGLILLAVMLFGAAFAVNDIFQQKFGSSLKISLKFSFISSIAGLIVLFAINGLKFEFTWFTLIMAFLSALISLSFNFCAFRALGSINLSLYSLFSMLGGMALPFVQGIVFYGENITCAKVICFVIICLALLLTVERDEKKSGTIYYIGVFVLNGMSGVLSKIFTASNFDKTSPEAYSVWIALCTIILSAFVLVLFFRKNLFSFTPAGIGLSALGGISTRVANLWLVIALANVDASVQYPMVTGGVMIVSTIICFFGKSKPSKKEIISILVAFVGMLTLLLPF